MKKRIGLTTLFALCSCGNHEVAGGSTVETDNAVTLQVSYADGKPASGATARIRPTWFVADTAVPTPSSFYSRDVQADSQGWIRCRNLGTGAYTVEITSKGTGAFAQFERLDTLKSDSIGTISLKPLGSIAGNIELPSGTPYAWIQIYGMDRVVKTDSAGFFSMDSLPPAAIHIRAVASQQASVIANDIVEVHSGYSWNIGIISPPTIATEDPLTWRYSQHVDAGILFSEWMQPISSPTVGYLRLDSSNFDFSQAMSDGRDLRFFDESGNRMIYQRARWNANLKTALIRIRIAELAPMSKIEMRWGCIGAIDPGSDGLWEGVPDSVIAELNSVLVGDFENGTLQSNLLPPVSPHSWYLIPQDTTVHMVPSTDHALSAIQPTPDRAGSAFHITSSGSPFKWALLGLKLDQGIPRNFEHLDSVVFWVRGQGNYQFGFENLSDNGGKAVFADSLDSVWTRKCIRPRDFLPGDGVSGNLGWENIQHSVTNLSFFAYGDVDFWLDDIRIYGLNRDDLQ